MKLDRCTVEPCEFDVAVSADGQIRTAAAALIQCHAPCEKLRVATNDDEERNVIE
jgi:hypothetical protein